MYIRHGVSSILTAYRSEMFTKILFVVSAAALAGAQVPSLGGCPEYEPMADFDIAKYLGVWYESARYFQFFEIGSRCVLSNYTQDQDGKLRVNNVVTYRLTGNKREFKGEIKPPSSKEKVGTMNVKYGAPLIPDIKYIVLGTDYKNYAVLWSCSGFGLVSSQNAWLMTRSRQPSNEVLQMANGVLDLYKISKTYLIKSSQEDCLQLDPTPSTEKPVKTQVNASASQAPEAAVTEAPQAATTVGLGRSAIALEPLANAVEALEPEMSVQSDGLAEPAEKPSADAPIASEILVEAENLSPNMAQIKPKPELRKPEPQLAGSAEKPAAPIASEISVQADDLSPELGQIKPKPELREPKPVEATVNADVSSPISVPEVVMKTSDRVKETIEEPSEAVKQFQPFQAVQEALANPVAQFQEVVSGSVSQIQEAISGSVAQIQETFSRPLGETFSGPLQNLQQTLSRPLQNIQQAFNRTIDAVRNPAAKPQEGVPEPIKKPVEPTKITVAETVTEKTP